MNYIFTLLSLSLFFSTAAVANMPRTDHELVPASQTLVPCGPVGKQGDILDKLIIIPATDAAGVVSVSDDANINLFAGGGTTALADLSPIVVDLGMRARSSTGFKVTTGANVSALCVGRFQ